MFLIGHKEDMLIPDQGVSKFHTFEYLTGVPEKAILLYILMKNITFFLPKKNIQIVHRGPQYLLSSFIRGQLPKMTKWLYLSHLTSYQENKGTLYSSTYKIEANKVVLFSCQEVKLQIYSHFVDLTLITPQAVFLKTKNGYISFI